MSNCSGIQIPPNAPTPTIESDFSRSASEQNPQGGTWESFFITWSQPGGLAWQAETVSLPLSSTNNSQGESNLSTVSTAVELRQSSVTGTAYWLGVWSSVATGLMAMCRFPGTPDPTRPGLSFQGRLDPLGFPELGENELVFLETSSGVQLNTVAGIQIVGEPRQLFNSSQALWPNTLRILRNDTISQITWRSTFPFTMGRVFDGYDRYSTRNRGQDSVGIYGSYFTWRPMFFSQSLLPDYDPNASFNWFGRHRVEVRVPEHPNSNQQVTFGVARFEVFFNALGNRNPAFATNRVPNWFYYYWKIFGAPSDVRYTSSPCDPRGMAHGCYDAGTNTVYIVNDPKNYITQNRPLFTLSQRNCNGYNNLLLTSSIDNQPDDISIYGIHTFLWTLYHERGHQWMYTTYFQAAPGVWRTIATRSSFDQDGDGLDDAWEAMNGLCPYSYDTTGRYEARGGDKEVVADIYAYNYLLQLQDVWRHDWSNLGLQKGNLEERFGLSSFPWKYHRTGTNQPPQGVSYVTGFPCPQGCP